MKNLFRQGVKNIGGVTERALSQVSNKFDLIKEFVNGLPILVSSQRVSSYGDKQYDEKHYFVIPFMLSESKIALHSMRCLPEGVPEINDLPKRRVFHFPNQHSEALVRHVLTENAKELVENAHSDTKNPLVSLADGIDALDKKLTFGMLAVGGVTAFVNPVLGAGIAAKALLPGAAGLLAKYGLKPMGEKISASQLQKKIKQAEDKIQSEFKSTSTLKVVNPILQELELALSTTAAEHDPLLDFDLSASGIEELDHDRWRELTFIALKNTYIDVIKNPELHEQASLGAEDLRWFKTFMHL